MSEDPRARELPDQINEWLTELAADRGISEEELVAQLLATDGVDLVTDDGEVDERLDELQADFQEKLEDVRKRVVQVKRETDSKAPADHDHEDIEAAIDRMADRMDELRAAIEDLEGRLEGGFENYEEVLEYLVEATEEIEGDLDAVAGAVEELQEEAAERAQERSDRAAVARLARSANEQGTSRAKCEACGEAVDIGLLTEPRCPHCEAGFTSVQAGGLFRSSVLETGTLPALDESGADEGSDRLVGERGGADRPERTTQDGADGFVFGENGGLDPGAESEPAPGPSADGDEPEDVGDLFEE